MYILCFVNVKRVARISEHAASEELLVAPWSRPTDYIHNYIYTLYWVPYKNKSNILCTTVRYRTVPHSAVR